MLVQKKNSQETLVHCLSVATKESKRAFKTLTSEKNCSVLIRSDIDEK